MTEFLSSFVKKTWKIFAAIFCLVLFSFYLFSNQILTGLGRFLIADEKPVPSDAVVVLYTGVEYYPRLMEAADLYNKGFVKKVIINGNRKTDILRSLEKKGLVRGCSWDDEYIRILNLLGVPEKDVISISAEDVYDTVSEAEFVGKQILEKGISSIIVTTSKSHTRRAKFIWESLYQNQISIQSKAAGNDPFDPASWWRDGRQVRWVLAEYGAFLYLMWKQYRGQE